MARTEPTANKVRTTQYIDAQRPTEQTVILCWAHRIEPHEAERGQCYTSAQMVASIGQLDVLGVCGAVGRCAPMLMQMRQSNPNHAKHGQYWISCPSDRHIDAPLLIDSSPEHA